MMYVIKFGVFHSLLDHLNVRESWNGLELLFYLDLFFVDTNV